MTSSHRLKQPSTLNLFLEFTLKCCMFILLERVQNLLKENKLKYKMRRSTTTQALMPKDFLGVPQIQLANNSKESNRNIQETEEEHQSTGRVKFNNPDLESQDIQKRILTEREIKFQIEKQDLKAAHHSRNTSAHKHSNAATPSHRVTHLTPITFDLKPQSTIQFPQSNLTQSLSSAIKRRLTQFAPQTGSLISAEEASQLQESGGFLEKNGIKKALYKFVQNKIQSHQMQEMQDKLLKQKEEEEKLLMATKAKKFVSDQIQQLTQIEMLREHKIEEAMKQIDSQLERKYQKNTLDWLKVQSKHDKIKPYLKQKLIEQLQNPDTELYKDFIKKSEKRRNAVRMSSALPMSRFPPPDILISDSSPKIKAKKRATSKKSMKLKRQSSSIKDIEDSIRETKTPARIRLKTAIQRSQTEKQLGLSFKLIQQPVQKEFIPSKDHSNVKKTEKVEKLNKEQLLDSVAKTKTLPQFIDSKKALSSGASLYHHINDTFNEFVSACSQVLENDENKKYLSAKMGQSPEKRMKFSFVNKATKDAVHDIFRTNGIPIDGDRSVPLMKSLKQKMSEDKNDPQMLMKKDLSETLKAIDEQYMQNHSGIHYSHTPTNVHHLVQSPQQKKKVERALISIWKNQNLKFKFACDYINVKSNNQQKNDSSQQQDEKKHIGELWNATNEGQYHQHKKDIRLRLTGQTSTRTNLIYLFIFLVYASTAPWDKVMMGSYTKLYKDKLDIKNYSLDKSSKETLKGINYEAVKEIVAGLPNLNSCIDQKYLQKQINSVETDTVQSIEASIANDIIRKYRSDQQVIKDSRFKYLQRKALETSTKIINSQSQVIKKNEMLQRCQDHSKLVRRFEIVLDGLENGWCTRPYVNQKDPAHRLYLKRKNVNIISKTHLMMKQGYTNMHLRAFNFIFQQLSLVGLVNCFRL